MGAWSPEPFDNDTAADYAHSLRAKPPAARLDFLMGALRHISMMDELPYTGVEYELQEALAAAAFVAEAHTGTHPFTDDNPFALGTRDDGSVLPFPELPPPTPPLLTVALHCTIRIEQHFTSAGSEERWVEPVTRIRKLLVGNP